MGLRESVEFTFTFHYLLIALAVQVTVASNQRGHV